MTIRKNLLAFTAAGIGVGAYHAVFSNLSGSERMQMLALFTVAGLVGGLVWFGLGRLVNLRKKVNYFWACALCAVVVGNFLVMFGYTLWGYIGTPDTHHHISATLASGLGGVVYGFVWRASLKARSDQIRQGRSGGPQ